MIEKGTEKSLHDKKPNGLTAITFYNTPFAGRFKKMNIAKTEKSLHDKKPNGPTAVTLGNALSFGQRPPKIAPTGQKQTDSR
ncbi:MAG TPA: hypothetical protein DCX03_10905 [Bacteroidales bacterium]|nr:hypothetical protein [Bacteroidales bacterium]